MPHHSHHITCKNKVLNYKRPQKFSFNIIIINKLSTKKAVGNPNRVPEHKQVVNL